MSVVCCQCREQYITTFLFGRVKMLEQTTLPLLFILSLITFCLCQVQLQSDCNTPKGNEGTCISIMDCPQLLKLVQKKDRTTEELQMLRNSQCNVMNKTIKVCCEITNDTRCYNPDGNLGVCVGATNCPTIIKLFQPPISTDNYEFIKNSRCEGPNMHSICCGPDPASNVKPSDVCEPSSAPPDPRTECCGLDNTHTSCHAHEDNCQDIDKPPNPTSNCCGIHLASDDLETNGDAAINQFPWLALIEDKNAKFICTGSLISSRHVLTAAQCKSKVLKRVILGAFNKTHSGPDCVLVEGKQICNDGVITIDVATVKYHPKFSLSNGHDIGIIKLADKVPYNEFIRPICLPTSDVLVSPPDNLRFVNAGWGFIPLKPYEVVHVKHYVTLPYVDPKKCLEIYGLHQNSAFKILDSHVCAGGEKGLDSCSGDQGGPLMLKEDGHYTVVGIVSFGSKRCGEDGRPSVYTKVYHYLNWINSVIAEL